MEKIASIQNSMSDNLLIDDTCRIIESARDYAYRAVNTALTIRNWKLGELISREHLDDNGRFGRSESKIWKSVRSESKIVSVDFVPRTDKRRG